MRSAWLLRAVARLAPADWRATIARDLDEEARAQGRGVLWCAWQAVRVALKLRWMSGGSAMLFDLRYAIRSLLAARWFTLGAIATFALGIGVNVAVLSAVDRMLFRPLPYGDGGRLVLLRTCNPVTGECAAGSFPKPVAQLLQERSSTMTDVAVAGRGVRYRVPNADDSDPGLALIGVSAGLLRALRVQPVIGRDITREEAGSEVSVAWLSHETWVSRFGADSAVVGRSLRNGTELTTIIGILPRGFIPPAWASPTPQWAGLIVNYDNWSTIGGTGGLMAPLARLTPGTTLSAAQAELDTVARSLRAEIVPAGRAAPLLRVHALEHSLFSAFQRYLWLLVATAALLLLLACANLASLFVARGRSRQHLTAICSALGASRARLVSGAVIESLVVCGAGALVAVATLALVSGALMPLLPPMFARYWAGAFDGRVLAVALVATVATGLVVGAAPAWRGARIDLLAVLQRVQRGGGRSRLGSRALLGVEAGLGTIIVLAGALAIQSFVVMSHEDLGFQPDRLHVVAVSMGRATPDQQVTMMQNAVIAARATSGVRSAATSDYGPARREAPMRGYQNPGGDGGPLVQVSDDYFETMGTPLIAGRPFSASEIAGRAPMVVLARSAALQAWPGVSPASVVGRMWQVEKRSPREVIGVVPDMKFAYGPSRLEATAYVPMGAEPSRWLYLVVRSDLDPTALGERLRAQLGDVTVATTAVASSMDVGLQDSRFRAILLATFGVVALLVASVGLYAVASYDVALRRYEMGVRLALGATAADIRRIVVLGTTWPVVTGAMLGLIAAIWLAKFAESFLYKTSGRDPLTCAVVLVVLIATAVLAAWIPALRAARTDPAIVLRAQ